MLSESSEVHATSSDLADRCIGSRSLKSFMKELKTAKGAPAGVAGEEGGK